MRCSSTSTSTTTPLVDILDWLAGEYRARLVSDPAPTAPAAGAVARRSAPRGPRGPPPGRRSDPRRRSPHRPLLVTSTAAGSTSSPPCSSLTPDADIEGLDPDRLDDALLFGRGENHSDRGGVRSDPARLEGFKAEVERDVETP